MKIPYLLPLLLIIGLSLRLFLLPLPGFIFDIQAWYSWAIRINEVGFAHFYSPTIWTNYTPGFLYILAFLGFLKNVFDIPSDIFYLIIKLPAILTDLLLATFIYKLFQKSEQKSFAPIAAIFVLFNPAVLFNSAVWGQIDSILTFLMILSVWFLKQNRLIPSSIIYALAILVKPQAIAIAPIFLLFLLKNFTFKNVLRLSIPFSLSIFLLSLPFFITTPFSGLLQLISNMIGDYPYNSLFAYNLWGILGFWINDQQTFLLRYQFWGVLLFLSFWIFISFIYLKNKINLYSLATLATFAFYFLPTRVHERYLFPALIFLLLSTLEMSPSASRSAIKSTALKIFFYIISTIHFLNLYYVYVYYNEVFNNQDKILFWNALYQPLDMGGKILSLISTILFVVISYTMIKKGINNAH